MTNLHRSEEVLTASVVERVYVQYRNLAGFQGVELSAGAHEDAKGARPVLRLHLAPVRDGGASPGLPAQVCGIPLELHRTRHSTAMAAPHPATVPHLTGGTACAAPEQARHGAGQVTIMACDRDAGRIGFLTSLASVAGVAGRRGSSVSLAGRGGAKVARVDTTCCGRAGLAGFCSLEPGQAWLPLERPGNLTITSLRRPAIGDCLRGGSTRVTVAGIGIYRIRTVAGDPVDIDGFRTRGAGPLPSGALVYDEALWSGVGLATGTATGEDGTVSALNCELAQVMAAMQLRLAGYDDLFRTDAPAPAAAPSRPGTSATASDRGRSAARARAARADRLEAVLGDPRDVIAGTAAGEDLEPNRRPDIATAIWPCLRRSLDRHGASRPRGITDRIERLDPAGRARARIARAVNGSEEFADLGLPHVGATDFRHCVTFDQVCERIADILAAHVEQPFQ